MSVIPLPDSLNVESIYKSHIEELKELEFLPAHLCKSDQTGKPRYKFFLGASNREQKRGASSSARINRLAVMAQINGDPDEELSKSMGKACYFWFDHRGQRRGNMLMNLLRSYQSNVLMAPNVDVDKLHQDIPVYERIIRRFESELAPRDMKIIVHHPSWTLWEKVACDLNNWNSLTDGRQEAVVNAVYALSGIFMDKWFIEEAVRSVPELAEGTLKPYFDNLHTLENEKRETRECAREGLSVDLAIDTWGGLGVELEDLASRIGAVNHPDAVLIEELQSIAIRYKALMASGIVEDSLRQEVVTRIGELINVIRALSTEDGFDWVLLSDIESRWGIQMLRAGAGEVGLSEVSDLIYQATEDLPEFEKDYRETFAKAQGIDENIRLLREQMLQQGADRKELRAKIAENEDELLSCLDHRDMARARFGGIAPEFDLSEGESYETLFECRAVGADAELLRQIGTFRIRNVFSEIVSADNQSEQPALKEDEPNTVADPVFEVIPVPVADDVAEPLSPEPLTDPERELEPAPVPPRMPEPIAAASQKLISAEPTTKRMSEPDLVVEVEAEPKSHPAIERLWYFAGEREPAVAAYLARIIGSESPVPAELFEVAALALSVQLPGGVIAQDISARLAAGRVTERLEKLNGDVRLAANMVAMAAAFRPSLLLSDPQVAELLSTIKVSGTLPHTAMVIDALLKAASTLQSFPMTAEVLRQVITVKSRDAALEASSRDAANWLASAEDRSRNRYIGAMRTFRIMAAQGEDGCFYDLLKPVCKNEKRQAAAVREMIGVLEDRTRYERRIADIDRRNTMHRAEKIAYRAMDWLHEERLAALSIAQSWVSLVSLGQEQGYIQEVVLEAIRVVQTKRDDVCDELNGLQETGSRAGHAAALALAGFESLVLVCGNGIPLPPSEPSVSAVLYEPMLRMEGFHVKERGGLDETPCDCEILLNAELLNWNDVWRKKADEFDFLGASLALDHLGEAGQPFEDELESMEKQARSRLIMESRQTEVAIKSLARLRGMPDADAEIFLQEINGHISRMMQDVPERRMDRTRAILTEAQNAIVTAEINVANTLRQSMEAIRKEGRSSRVLDLVQKNIDSRNFVVAVEYMDLAEREGDAALDHIESQEEDVFEKFYPGLTGVLAKAIGDSSSEDIANMILMGGAVGELSFADLDASRREGAAELWSAWRKLKAYRGNRPEVGQIMEVIAKGLGFGINPVVVLQTNGTNEERSSAYMTVDTIADRHRCPVHQYGSSARGMYHVVVCHLRPNASEMVRIAAKEAHSQTPTIICHLGAMSDRTRRDIGLECRNKKSTVIVLDDSLVLYLCSRNGDRLAPMFACTLPFSGIDPYVTVANQKLPPEMFFGRESEIQNILSPKGSCLVYGGRQLGKTALLRETERIFHDPSREHYAFHDEIKVNYPSEIWSRLRTCLDRAGIDLGLTGPFDPDKKGQIEELVGAIEKWLKIRPNARIIAMLDEADMFLSKDSMDNYHHTQQIKLLIANTEGRFKAVFAGLHNVLRMSTRSNHPLAHLGVPIKVGPFLSGNEISQAYRLIREPLRMLGYRFTGIEQVTQILGQTNYYPSLIQLYCQHLLHALSSRPREKGGYVEVDTRIIDQAYQNRKLPDLIKDKLDITLHLDERYAVIAQALAYEIISGSTSLREGVDVLALRRLVNEYWRVGFETTTSQGFSALLEELDTLGILALTTGRRDHYTFRNANVLMLMGSESVLISDLESERELVTEIDPSLVHAPLESSSRIARSPFNHAQDRLLREAVRQVLIVCGTDLSPLDRVHDGLRCVFGEDVIRCPSKTDSSGLVKILKAAVADAVALLIRGKQTNPVVVTVYPDTSWKASWLESIKEWLRREASQADIRVIFVANASQMKEVAEAVGRSDVPVVTLDAWNENFVYAWLRDIGAVLDPAVKRKLYRVTGGWGGLLADFVGKSAAVDKIRERVAEMDKIPVEDRSLWQKRLGVTDSNGLTGAVEFLEVLGAGMSTEEIREYLGTDPEPWITWARLMGFAVAETQEQGGWQLNALVAEVFRIESVASVSV